MGALSQDWFNKLTGLFPVIATRANFNSKIQKEAQRRLHDTFSNQEAQKTVASAVSYNIERWQNWLQSYWDSNPIHKNPKFGGLFEFYEMDVDPKILSSFNQRKDTLINRPWFVNPAIENNREEVIKATFAKVVIQRIRNLNNKKKQILSDMDYGYSVSEKILGFEDITFPIRLRTGQNKYENEIITIKNALVVKAIENIVPTAFSFDGERNMWFGHAGQKPRKLRKEEQINLIRSTFDDRFGSPYGWPLKASIFSHRISKKAILSWRLIYLEKYSIGTIHGTYPVAYNAKSKEVIDFVKALDSIMHSARIATPEGFEAKFINDANKQGTMDMFQVALNHLC